VTERPLAVFDIDGVVADVRHRLRYVERRPKDWDAFFDAAVDDPPHPEGVDLVREHVASGHDVVFLTGRPERCRRDTERWLGEQGIGGFPLHMRPARDRRPAAVVKVQLLARLAADREVAVVVDDDELVVEALRRAGWNVVHADWEVRAAAEQAALLEAQELEGRS
jgi:phosphoglycolate phosphatase-like HAD superfamily hydrolase